jgi:hypothetical protein
MALVITVVSETFFKVLMFSVSGDNAMRGGNTSQESSLLSGKDSER